MPQLPPTSHKKQKIDKPVDLKSKKKQRVSVDIIQQDSITDESIDIFSHLTGSVKNKQRVEPTANLRGGEEVGSSSTKPDSSSTKPASISARGGATSKQTVNNTTALPECMQAGSSSVDTASGNEKFAKEFLTQSVLSFKSDKIPEEKNKSEFIRAKIASLGTVDKKKIEDLASGNGPNWSRMQKEVWNKFSPTTNTYVSPLIVGTIHDISSEISKKKMEILTLRGETSMLSTPIVSDSEALRALQLKFDELSKCHKTLVNEHTELLANTGLLARAAYDLNVAASQIVVNVQHVVDSTDFIAKMTRVSTLTTKEDSDADG